MSADEVMRLAGEGKTDAAIAVMLGWTPGRVWQIRKGWKGKKHVA